MRKFYIIFSDTSYIEGEIDCNEEEFEKRLITPNKEVHSWRLGPVLPEKITDEELNEELKWT